MGRSGPGRGLVITLKFPQISTKLKAAANLFTFLDQMKSLRHADGVALHEFSSSDRDRDEVLLLMLNVFLRSKSFLAFCQFLGCTSSALSC